MMWGIKNYTKNYPKVYFLLLLFTKILMVLSWKIKKGKKMAANIKKEEVKLFLLANGTFTYTENPKESIKKSY